MGCDMRLTKTHSSAPFYAQLEPRVCIVISIFQSKPGSVVSDSHPVSVSDCEQSIISLLLFHPLRILLRQSYVMQGVWVVTALILLLSGGGCSTPSISRTVKEEPNRFVRLDVRYRTGGEEHRHPVELSETELANALRSVSARPQRGLPSFLIGQKEFPFPSAFSVDMVKFLASLAADALQRATPLEEVVFYFNQPREEGPIREITSGSLYMQGDRIHLVLANYRHGTAGTMDIERAQEDPLTILGESLYEFLPGPHGQIEESTGLASLFMDSHQHISIDYAAEAKAAQDLTGSPGLTISEKLYELDSLRRLGLITEEQFQQKRKQLLDAY